MSYKAGVHSTFKCMRFLEKKITKAQNSGIRESSGPVVWVSISSMLVLILNPESPHPHTKLWKYESLKTSKVEKCADPVTWSSCMLEYQLPFTSSHDKHLQWSAAVEPDNHSTIQLATWVEMSSCTLECQSPIDWVCHQLVGLVGR